MTRPLPSLLSRGAVRALVLVALAALAHACSHTPNAKEQQAAQIHYDLGIQAQQAGDMQGAYAEFLRSIELDPGFAEVRNAIGLVLHVGFNRLEEAEQAYLKALELRPGFSEAKTNLGNVYVAQGKYDQAIKLYEEALNDMLYPTPYIAQGNLGWALYKKGDSAKALDQIKSAVTANPKYCLGYLWMGTIHEDEGNVELACRQFGRYRENCPEDANAYFKEGLCLAKQGDNVQAAERLLTCEQKAEGDLRDECRSLGAKLKGAP